MPRAVKVKEKDLTVLASVGYTCDLPQGNISALDYSYPNPDEDDTYTPLHKASIDGSLWTSALASCSAQVDAKGGGEL